MRVCVEKLTGLLIESQSFATEGTLLQNAINAGHTESGIEEKVVTNLEYQQILDNQPKPPQQTSTDDYLLDLDFRLSMIELGL